MHRYFIKIPWIVKKIFSSYAWNIPTDEKEVYLTFDDGPHPTITPWVLEELRKYNAYATFFCIGKNVEQFKETYESILNEGHAIGNHTYNHLNGWETTDDRYLQDILDASQLIHSNLFRPPYGKIKLKQARRISEVFNNRIQIIMWDTLSGDFDKNYSAQQCVQNVIKNVRNGSIIVFHDSEKAYERLHYALPAVLQYFSEKGYRFGRLGDVL